MEEMAVMTEVRPILRCIAL